MTTKAEDFEAMKAENEALKKEIKMWEERWERMQEYNLRKAVEFEGLRKAALEMRLEMERVLSKLEDKSLVI